MSTNDPTLEGVARDLESAFETFYKEEKSKIERRKRHLSILKSRCGIKDSTVPASVENVTSILFNEILGE